MPATDCLVLAAPAIRDFIRAHEDADVRELALKPLPDASWPRAAILDQIRARQIAKRKTPDWLAEDGVIFPAADVMEQCSSTATARYKASLVKGRTFADLTAGAGIDARAFARHFDEGVCVEKDAETAAILAHNLSVLTPGLTVVHQSAEDYIIKDMPTVDLAFLDPQRRTAVGRRGLISLEETAPPVIGILSDLRAKAAAVMLKTSPALDIMQALQTLATATAVHVVEWQGACREVLYLLEHDKTDPQDVPVTAVTIDDDGAPAHKITFTRRAEQNVCPAYGPPQRYLFEPAPAFMKAGCFTTLAQTYNLTKLHPHTHLYTSDTLPENFPGRCFEIGDTLAPSRKAVKAALSSGRANLAVRNYPAAVDDLKKKLNLRDGGDDYLFACTLADNSRVLIHAGKITG